MEDSPPPVLVVTLDKLSGERDNSNSLVGVLPSGKVIVGSGPSSSSTKFSKDDFSFFFNSSILVLAPSGILSSGSGGGRALLISIDPFMLVNLRAAEAALDAFTSAEDTVDVDDDEVT